MSESQAGMLVDDIRQKVSALLESQPTAIKDISKRTGLAVPTIHSFVRGDRKPHPETFVALSKYISRRGDSGGFVHAETYLNVLGGLKHRYDWITFSDEWKGDYQILRRDLLTNDPVVSNLSISFEQNRISRFLHHQYASDDLNDDTEHVEEGFVFLCGGHISLVSTSEHSGIVSMTVQRASGPIMIGIMLSATRNINKVPFAAKFLMKKVDRSERWPKGRSSWNWAFDSRYQRILANESLIALLPASGGAAR